MNKPSTLTNMHSVLPRKNKSAISLLLWNGNGFYAIIYYDFARFSEQIIRLLFYCGVFLSHVDGELEMNNKQ